MNESSNRKARGLVALEWFLTVLAVLAAVVGAMSGALSLRQAQGQDTFDGSLSVVLDVAWRVALGLGAAGVLWALACITRLLQRAQESRPAEPSAASTAAPAATSSANAAPPSGDAVLDQLKELNVNLLLSESQRQLKRDQVLRRQAERLARELDAALTTDDVDAAQRLLDQLTAVAPDWPNPAELRRRFAAARAQADARAVEAPTRQVEELMAKQDYDAAEKVAQAHLSERADSAALLVRVRREREHHATQQRLSLYQRIETDVVARHWRSAVTAANEFLAAYPKGSDAELLRAQLSTLNDNAHLEETRALRDRIRELIETRSFAQAVEMARDLIGRFPQTAAADELRKQMPKLEELAKAPAE